MLCGGRGEFFDDAWNYFYNLANNVSASKCKVAPTQEFPSLTIFYFPSTHSTFVPSFSVDLSLFFCLLFGNIFKIQVFWLNNRKTKYVIPCNFKFLSIKGVQDFYPKTCFFVIKMLFFKCSGFFTLFVVVFSFK